MANRYRDWFRQAEADLELARDAMASGSYEWSCYAALLLWLVLEEQNDDAGNDKVPRGRGRASRSGVQLPA